MKKLFLVLLAGALFVACGNKAEEAEEAVVEEPVVEEVVVEEPVVEEVVAEEPVAETTVKQEAKKAATNVAKEAIKKGENEALKTLKDEPAESTPAGEVQHQKRR